MQQFSDAFENHMSEITLRYNHEFSLDTIFGDIKEKQTYQKLEQYQKAKIQLHTWKYQIVVEKFLIH